MEDSQPAAMALLHHGVDLSVIAFWLGHESTETTQIYLHVMKKPGLGTRSPLDSLAL